MTEQTFANHGRFVPPYHFFVIPVLVINFGWSIYRWKVAGFSVDGFISIVVALALLLGFLTVRLMALSVQDRVIRVEERLRYDRVLPADLKPRVAEITLNQFVSLRFASDAELPALARKVLDEKLDNRKAIKQLIKNWKPDYLRA
jgi:Family of unknown function (DUF6526)